MIYAANLKAHHNRTSFTHYAQILNSFLKERINKDEIIVFPPSTAFYDGTTCFIQGAQNFYPCINGAYTGEIGKEHLDEFKINCVLIGHSERRIFENEFWVKKKFDFAKEAGYKIILCIGESLEIKKQGKTEAFLQKQLENLDLSYEKLIIAYEPIYSIGTGESAKSEDIAKILSFLHSLSKAKLLYGGSVNEKNIKELLSLEFCSGVLIGSAALKVENFIKLIRNKSV